MADQADGVMDTSLIRTRRGLAVLLAGVLLAWIGIDVPAWLLVKLIQAH